MMEFDERYISLMEMYKQLRRDPNKEHLADKALTAANQILVSGKVSSNAKEIVRYM